MSHNQGGEGFYWSRRSGTIGLEWGKKVDIAPNVVDQPGSWYTSIVGIRKKLQNLDVATGLAWLQAFADKYHIDTAKWSVQRLDDSFGYQGLPDEAIAEKLADFIASKYRVQTHVYEPMGCHWQVVVMQK